MQYFELHAPNPSSSMNRASFYSNYKGLIKAIIFNENKSKEDKEKVLGNLLEITQNEYIYREMYDYIQKIQSGNEIDLEHLYKGDSLPYPKVSKEQLDLDMDKHKKYKLKTQLKLRLKRTISGYDFLNPHPQQINSKDSLFLNMETKNIHTFTSNLSPNAKIFEPFGSKIAKPIKINIGSNLSPNAKIFEPFGSKIAKPIKINIGSNLSPNAKIFEPFGSNSKTY